MRTNLPVTQTEYQFPASETLLSTTDVDSHISYANAAFIRTSGFAPEQLMGQPHNLVRHPDMPVEAFADMWHSLKEGQNWRALVKNRRSNGDHYWVVANAASKYQILTFINHLHVRSFKVTQQEHVVAAKDHGEFQQVDTPIINCLLGSPPMGRQHICVCG